MAVFTKGLLQVESDRGNDEQLLVYREKRGTSARRATERFDC